MSRSIRGSKGLGHDYWSRRHGNDSMHNAPTLRRRGSGTTVKQTTNRWERRKRRRELFDSIEELDEAWKH